MKNKKALKELSILGAIIILIAFIVPMVTGYQDIQLYDMYIVSTTFWAWVTLGVLAVVFLIRCIIQKFKNIWTNVILIIAVLGIGYMIISFYYTRKKLENDFMHQQ